MTWALLSGMRIQCQCCVMLGACRSSLSMLCHALGLLHFCVTGTAGGAAHAQLDAGRGPHLAAAAPRHLLHRGPGAAHLRPQVLQPRCAAPAPRAWRMCVVGILWAPHVHFGDKAEGLASVFSVSTVQHMLPSAIFKTGLHVCALHQAAHGTRLQAGACALWLFKHRARHQHPI